jgi:hypothetical protein
MRKKRTEQSVPRATRSLALTVLAFALTGCGSTSDLLKSSPLDMFSSSSKATRDPAPAGAATPISADDIDCPEVQVRTGAATLMIGSKPGEAAPNALDVRYQGSIIRTARECRINAGMMTIKVGIEGRVITGPAGGPGTVDVPLRVAVVQEGVNPKTVATAFGKEVLTVNNSIDRVTFTHIEPDITFPLPQPLGLIDRYVIYVGFDPLGDKPVKKPPVKRKPVAKKPVAKPQG